MHIRFTKMQGAGNDFVVLDETAGPLGLTPAQYRWLADRHFGVGADQILGVRQAPQPDVDFEYVIHNNDGGEVEHCGNGARCFVRFVRGRGLTDKRTVRVKIQRGIIELTENEDGGVTVDMGAPVFDLPLVPFNPAGMEPLGGGWSLWPVVLSPAATVHLAVLSMGNPHAVQLVDDVDTAPVLTQGPLIESHPAFPNRVNAGFMQIENRSQIRLRVYERGAGETLACGTGACAAVVAGIRLGLLDQRVQVATRGGALTIEWAGHDGSPVLMTGPASTVFEGEIEIPESI
ncbi:diaminopimelate epimerase [Ottowia thiooxydans]|uniref:diaminopimelate epimerase n=1 Tax=Ottowia thiooxydans TaxID=219182 RepID=UPI0003FE50D1|nr:diaminopimelate epimerase [Ottowia thiooxydans]